MVKSWMQVWLLYELNGNRLILLQLDRILKWCRRCQSVMVSLCIQYPLPAVHVHPFNKDHVDLKELAARKIKFGYTPDVLSDAGKPLFTPSALPTR